MSKWPLLVLLAVAGCQYGAAPATPAKVVSDPIITGTINVMDMPTAGHFQSNVVRTPGGCKLVGDETDINAGTVVTLSAVDGTPIATAKLGPGRIGTDQWTCSFSWSFGSVRETSSSYGVEVGHRGRSGVTNDVLVANRYHFTLALGGM